MTQPLSIDPRGQHLHLDCASGAAGDMMLGALIDLGVPLDVIGDALEAIGAGRHRLAVTKIVKHGIGAVDVKVDTTGHIVESRQQTHAHHGPQPTRPTPPSIPRPGTPPMGVPHQHQHPHPGAAHPSRAQRPITEPPATTSASGSGKFVGIKFRAETHERHIHVDELGDKVEEVLEYASAGHSHSHPHAHYLYADIRTRIARAKLTDGTRARALDIFDRLARAEAKLHGTTVDEVQFHEVGAIDSIVDVVGSAAALDWLSPTHVTCVAVAMGHGTLHSAHGTLPVPAPAALEVLREAQGVMTDGGLPRELCTPTGAAILAHAVTLWTPAPPGRAVAVGWGAGDFDLPDRPNVLRATILAPVRLDALATGAVAAPQLASPSGAVVATGDTVWQIDANLDDMSPELCGPASDALFAAGALDVWWTPITMKKGRPALTLSALVELPRRDAVITAMLRETTTIGVRYTELQRTVLTRKLIEVETRYGVIPVKVAVDGNTILNAAPEYEACAKAAKIHQVPVKLVYSAALAAYDARR